MEKRGRPGLAALAALLLLGCGRGASQGAPARLRAAPVEDQRVGARSRPASRAASRPALPEVTAYDALLRRVVRGGGVDYGTLRKERAALDAFVAALAAADPKRGTKAERLAFWINAYNAVCLQQVLDLILGKGFQGRDLEGVRAVGGDGFFRRKAAVVAGRPMSLDEIETRARALGDPRVHFAVNCASRSCPPLRAGAWRAATLDRDLEEAARSFLRSPQGLRIEGGRLRVSPILKWYARDFGGREGVRAFLAARIPPSARPLLARGLSYLRYDWRLNRAPAPRKR